MLEKNEMPLNLTVPVSLARALKREAKALGLSVPEYTLHVLARRTTKPTRAPKTGQDLVEYWRVIGVIGTRDDFNGEDSATHARGLRAQAERRQPSAT